MIKRLEPFDLRHVKSVSVEAFKACAASAFKCVSCLNVVRGANLARCDKGHLVCLTCLDFLVKDYRNIR
jgi:hypothetical protein